MKTITTSEVDNLYKWAKGDLYTAYANPSDAKRSKWDSIRREVVEYGGHDLVVRSRNCHIFTAMYIVGMQLVVIYPKRHEYYQIVEGV